MVHGASAVEKGRACYHALGLPECSALEVVKKKYKELALALHPDKNLGDPHAADKFKQITAAYEQLSHPDKKKTIDESIATFRLNLHTGSGTETAASLFQMQRGRYYDDLHSFRTQRRATSQVTKAFSRGDSTAGQRPSQYSKEQLSDFRQREKERERERIRRMERDREEQRQTELERYRQAQEERMREEDRRSREALRKLERAEAALSGQRPVYPHMVAASTSQPSARGGKAQLLTSPQPKSDGVAPRRGAYRSQSCDLGVPVLDDAASPASAGTDGTSVASSTSPLSNGGAFRYSNTAASPLSPPWGARTSSQRPGLSDSPPAPQMTQQMRVAREKERQDAIRRAEQERYYDKLAAECRQREVQRSREAAEAEQRGFSRELQLLLENENGERKQYLEQEEDLERRILCASMRRTESLLLVALVRHDIEDTETRQRSAVACSESVERQRVMLVFHWRLSVLHLWSCEETCRNDMERKHAGRCQEMARAVALQRELASCEADGRDLLCRQFDAGCVFLWTVFGDEPGRRVALVASELSHRRRVMCFAESLQSRVDVMKDETRCWLLLQCRISQSQSRLTIETLEVQNFMHVQRRKGQHMQQLFQDMKQRMAVEKETIALRHESYIEALIQQISSLQSQLASRACTANAHVGTTDGMESSVVALRSTSPLHDSVLLGNDSRPSAAALAGANADVLSLSPSLPLPQGSDNSRVLPSRQQQQQQEEAHPLLAATLSEERALPPKFRPLVSPVHEEAIVPSVTTTDAATGSRPHLHPPPAMAAVSPITALTSTPLLRTRTWGSASGAQSANPTATSVFVSAPKVAKRQSPPQGGEPIPR